MVAGSGKRKRGSRLEERKGDERARKRDKQKDRKRENIFNQSVYKGILS